MSDFLIASEWLEFSPALISIIAECGSIGADESIDAAYKDFERLNTSYVEHGPAIESAIGSLASVSDGIERFDGQKRISVRPEHIIPKVFSSAHELALGIVRFALAEFFYPAVEIDDPHEQFERAKFLLTSWYRAIELTADEVGMIQGKIRRERAKLLEKLGNFADFAAVPSVEETPPLTREDTSILRCMLKSHPQLMTLLDIEGESDVSRKTIGKRLEGLQVAGLVHRPNGPKKGAGLSERGKTIAERLP